MRQDRIKSIRELIPASIWIYVHDLKVIEAGWAAGPSWVLRKTQKFSPPVTLNIAFKWLEEYREVFRKCHLLLDDRSVLWINRHSFERYYRTDCVLKESSEGIEFETDEGMCVAKLFFDE